MNPPVAIVCLKSLPKSLEEQLRTVAQRVICIEPFEVEYILNLPRPEPGYISIFTSQRALKALQLNDENNPVDYTGMECLCVGSRTALLAGTMGFSVVYSAKNANDLINYVETSYTERRTFVHYCASDRLDVLSSAMVFRTRHHFKEVVSYRKHPKRLSYSLECDVLMAFSPSGIAFARRHLNNVSEVRVFCIGATTAQAARRAGFSDVRVAGEPTVQAVCDLVSKTLGQK